MNVKGQINTAHDVIKSFAFKKKWRHKENETEQKKIRENRQCFVQNGSKVSMVVACYQFNNIAHAKTYAYETNIIVYIQNLCAGNRKRKQILFMEIFSIFLSLLYLSFCMHLFSLFGLVLF